MWHNQEPGRGLLVGREETGHDDHAPLALETAPPCRILFLPQQVFKFANVLVAGTGGARGVRHDFLRQASICRVPANAYSMAGSANQTAPRLKSRPVMRRIQALKVPMPSPA